MDFKIGDTVQVKSGGPLLTVLETNDELVHCLFFSEELGNFQRDSFPASVLEEVEIIDDEDDVKGQKKLAASQDDEDEDEEDLDDDMEDDEKKDHSEKAA